MKIPLTPCDNFFFCFSLGRLKRKWLETTLNHMLELQLGPKSQIKHSHVLTCIFSDAKEIQLTKFFFHP